MQNNLNCYETHNKLLNKRFKKIGFDNWYAFSNYFNGFV